MEFLCEFLASMVGGTIFVLTGTIARNKSGPATFVAYILAGFIAILNATTYAELSCRFPKVSFDVWLIHE